ncbi:MAG: efflux RND transporter periplasmic adaptor subunit [Kiritimatiellae bacterium]|nr:efflux RND transporter periplasmic adaptor subunit [Kiritimatiellia bacterium]
MKKFSKTVLVLLLLGAAGFGAWWWYAGRGGAALGGGKVQYKTAAAAAGEIAQTVTANGSLGAVRTVDVGSEVSGKIVELFADYNSAVTNGQLLARLDDSSYLRTREQCEAELESARADLKLAEANFRRAGELRAADLLSDADYDQTEAALAKARASLRQRTASLDKANVDIAKTLVYSPMDGMVLSRSVDVGQTVAASMTTPVLFTLAKDLRDMRIEAEISEADVGGVAEGQEVVFTVDAYPDSEFTGTVSQVRYEPVTSQNVVNYIAIVDVVNADLKLRPGMTANASVVTAKRTGALRVPNAALRFRPAEGESVADAAPPAPPRPPAAPSASAAPCAAPPSPPAGATPKTVYVLDPATGALRRTPILAGITDGTWTEVLAGLSEGDPVVTGRADAASAAAAAPRSGGGSPFLPGPPPRR